MAHRVLGDLHENAVPGLQGVLDPPLLTVGEAGGVPVHLTGVEHGVAATTDVDEGGLHARQHVLHLAEVHVADHRRGGRRGHVVLDQDVVLEDRDLGEVAALADHHDPVDRLAASQELGLGQDRGSPPAGLTALPTALLLGLQPGGPAHRGSGVALGPLARLTDVDDGPLRVVRPQGALRLALGAGPAAATATTAGGRRAGLALLGVGVGRWSHLGDGTLGGGRLGTRFGLLAGAGLSVLAGRLAAAAAAPAAATLAARAFLALYVAFVTLRLILKVNFRFSLGAGGDGPAGCRDLFLGLLLGLLDGSDLRRLEQGRHARRGRAAAAGGRRRSGLLRCRRRLDGRHRGERVDHGGRLAGALAGRSGSRRFRCGRLGNRLGPAAGAAFAAALRVRLRGAVGAGSAASGAASGAAAGTASAAGLGGAAAVMAAGCGGPAGREAARRRRGAAVVGLVWSGPWASPSEAAPLGPVGSVSSIRLSCSELPGAGWRRAGTLVSIGSPGGRTETCGWPIGPVRPGRGRAGRPRRREQRPAVPAPAGSPGGAPAARGRPPDATPRGRRRVVRQECCAARPLAVSHTDQRLRRDRPATRRPPR